MKPKQEFEGTPRNLDEAKASIKDFPKKGKRYAGYILLTARQRLAGAEWW
jgi:hypothetical protein